MLPLLSAWDAIRDGRDSGVLRNDALRPSGRIYTHTRLGGTVLCYMCACVADGLPAFRNVNQPADSSPTATANHNVVTRIDTVALTASGLVTPNCTDRENTVASACPDHPV